MFLSINPLAGMGSEGAQRKKESMVFHQDQLSGLGIGVESEEKPWQVACSRAVDGAEELDLDERSGNKNLKLTFCYSGQLASLTGFAGVSGEVGGWYKTMN